VVPVSINHHQQSESCGTPNCLPHSLHPSCTTPADHCCTCPAASPCPCRVYALNPAVGGVHGRHPAG
jgi:hypothetical protein